MEKIKIKNIDIKYNFEDTGKQKVLYIHGYESSSKAIDELMKIGRTYDIVSLDLPGNGETEYNDLVSFELHVEVIKEFIKKLKLKDVVLLGHSLGGALSTYVADMDEVKKAILLNPLNPYSYDHAKKLLGKEGIFTNMFKLNSEVKTSSRAARLLKFVNNFRETNRKLITENILNSDWQGNELYSKYLENRDKIEIITCSEDFVITMESIIKLNEHINIKYVVLEGAGHSPISVDPKGFNDIFENVLK